jgi:hypothetical protein
MTTHDLEQLIFKLEGSSKTDEPTYDEASAIRWQTPDPIIDRAATNAWIRLKQFIFDGDIRARDIEYDRKFRAELAWRADELKALQTGGDPYGRRNSKRGRFARVLFGWLRKT